MGAFQAVLHVELEDAITRRPFHWFASRVAYLLADDNPYSRLFRDD